MALAAPFLIAGYPTITTAPEPATGDAVQGLQFETGSGWNGSTAKLLSTGPDADGADAGDINAAVEYCCPRVPLDDPMITIPHTGSPAEDVPNPVGGYTCTRVAPTSSCDTDETRHTVTGWEDGASISVNGYDLHYNYNQFDLAWWVVCKPNCGAGCYQARCYDNANPPNLICTTQQQVEDTEEQCDRDCNLHCGWHRTGPVRDNDSPSVNPGNRVYQATLSAATSGVWENAAESVVEDLDTGSGERAPSVVGDEMFFAGYGSGGDEDLFSSTRTSGTWGTSASLDTTYGSAPYINSACRDENPHVVEDDTGLRLYFESDRDPSLEGGAPYTESGLWDDPSECLNPDGNPTHERSLWVIKRTGSTWGELHKVALPGIYRVDPTDGTTLVPWTHSRREAVFVTAGDPEAGDPDVGRQIYWAGRESDCYPEFDPSSPTNPGPPANSNDASQQCLYMATQSTAADIDDAWVGTGGSPDRAIKVATPTPVVEADLGDVGVVTDVSVTGDRQYLYFTLLRRTKWDTDVEPPFDAAEALDDSDPRYPPEVGDGIEFGGMFQWGDWKYAAGLAHPANYASSGDTSGWEDSINISDDGRRLYFGYSTYVFGQGAKAGPDPANCGQSPPNSCPGRAVFPRFLTRGPTRPVLPFSGSSSPPVAAKLGLGIYEATIDTSGTPVWDVDYSAVNYDTYCTPDASCSSCAHVCLDRAVDDDYCVNDLEAKVLYTGSPGTPNTSHAECITPAEQGQMEGAVTVSTDDAGVERMLFVRYGDLTEVTSYPLGSSPDPDIFRFKLYETSRNCGTNSDEWCTPTLATKLNSSSCFDNDPHLTAGGTSVYFDSNRSAATDDKCFKFLLKDWHVYHSRKNCSSGGTWNGGTDWCTPAEVINGPNIEYIAQTDSLCGNCPSGCSATPTSTPCPADCPLFCAPRTDLIGTPAYKARQAFVTEDESLMLFTGKGGNCVPDPSKPWIETVDESTGFCLYASRRDGDYTDPGTGYVIPKWESPFLVARPQPTDARPCRGSSDTDIGKIVGLGEPSMTKDGRLLYFAYVRKTVAGTPLTTPSLCTESSPDPSNPDNALCRCDIDEENHPEGSIAPTGCWLPWCDDPDFTGTRTPGKTCKEACDDPHVAGTDNDECLPFSVLFCANPKESETSSVDGVDVYEFGIGRARREHWDVSIAVVEAQ